LARRGGDSGGLLSHIFKEGVKVEDELPVPVRTGCLQSECQR